jgi:hypothetical protein
MNGRLGKDSSFHVVVGGSGHIGRVPFVISMTDAEREM